MGQREIAGRGAAVLDAVVERFIITGEPVGSGTLVELLPEKVSPATVRNVMAELERLGFLEQPHTSAGRQPTRRGYESYAERVLETRRDSLADAEMVRSRLAPDSMDFEELLRETCQVLSELSELVGLVSGPSLAETVFQHIDFVALEGGRVLAIVVARSGQSKHRLVVLDEPMEQEQLDRAASYLVSRFAGRSLREVSRRVHELRHEAYEQLDRYERRAISLGAESMNSDMTRPAVVVEGTSRLLARRELGDRDHLRTVLEIIEGRTELSLALTPGAAGRPRVVVGTDPLPAGLEGCTLVSASYGPVGQAFGTVAILGPVRLPYARVISVVEAVAEATSTAMARLL